MEDPTFRAYRRDRNFLKSILNISDELNFILQRIFEVDPQRRISLDELYHAIYNCQSFSKCSALPSPVEQPVSVPFTSNGVACGNVPTFNLPAAQYPQQQYVKYVAPQTGLHTPPSSGHCTPQPSLHPYPQKAVPSYHHQFRRYANLFQTNFVPSHAVQFSM